MYTSRVEKGDGFMAGVLVAAVAVTVARGHAGETATGNIVAWTSY